MSCRTNKQKTNTGRIEIHFGAYGLYAGTRAYTTTSKPFDFIMLAASVSPFPSFSSADELLKTAIVDRGKLLLRTATDKEAVVSLLPGEIGSSISKEACLLFAEESLRLVNEAFVKLASEVCLD